MGYHEIKRPRAGALRRGGFVYKFSFSFILFLICHIIFIFYFGSCTQKVNLSRAEFVLGTNCVVSLFENANVQVLKDVFVRLREIDNLMSVNIPASDVSRINAAAGVESVKVNEDVFELIAMAVYFAEISGGAFDPTIGPIVNLWGFNNNPSVPLQEEIDAVLKLVNWTDIVLDSDSTTVFLKKPGMALDLGAIAKGYAADETAKIITNAGINRAIVNLGGNIVVIGKNKDDRPWRVGIQDPNGERGSYIEVVEVSTNDSYMSVVTSGAYERFFEQDGKRYHHIFSPSTGYPVKNELLSVTIIAPNSMYADALSTAVFVMGYEIGLELIESIEGIEAVFVFEDGVITKF